MASCEIIKETQKIEGAEEAGPVPVAQSPGPLVPQSLQLCRSCSVQKPVEKFDGKQTCNDCRPLKKRKRAEAAQRKLDEIATLRAHYHQVVAELEQVRQHNNLLQLALPKLSKQNEQLAEENRWLRELDARKQDCAQCASGEVESAPVEAKPGPGPAGSASVLVAKPGPGPAPLLVPAGSAPVLVGETAPVEAKPGPAMPV